MKRNLETIRRKKRKTESLIVVILDSILLTVGNVGYRIDSSPFPADLQGRRRLAAGLPTPHTTNSLRLPLPFKLFQKTCPKEKTAPSKPKYNSLRPRYFCPSIQCTSTFAILFPWSCQTCDNTEAAPGWLTIIFYR
jgi:hypothetical protein